MHAHSIVRSVSKFKVNVVIKILILSDFVIWSTNNLLAPIFAIYVADFVPGAGIEAVGIASAVYLVVKSIAEVPVGIYIDRSKSERDDLYTAVIGTALSAFVYVGYIFINDVWHLYLLQGLLGLSAAFAFPGWYLIFTRHIDKSKEAFEWSLYDVFLGLGMAATAALSGFWVSVWGFDSLFITLGVMTFVGALLLLIIRKRIYEK